MLASMRKSATSIYAKIFIFGALIISFGAWGLADYTGGVSQVGTTAAYVGDEEISIRRLDQLYREQLRQANLQAIEPEQAQALGLGNQALEGLISESLINQEAVGLGLTAPDNVVIAEIQNNPTFRDSFGQFSRAQYEGFLQFSGLTEAVYVASLRREIARRQLLEAMISGAGTPSSVSKRLYAWRNETRSAEILTIPISDTLEVGTPGDAALRAYYDANSEVFRNPEYRGASYIYLNAEDLQAEVQVSEEQIEDAYQARIAEFTVAERRTIRQMLLDDEETARTAVERVRGGEDFLAVAAELAGSDADSVELGSLSRDELADEVVAAAAFSLNAGETSEPQEGIFGWFVLQVTDVSAGSQQPLSEVRDTVRSGIAGDEAIEVVYRLSTDLDDQLGGGATLEEAAAALNLEVKKVDAISRSGQTPDGAQADVPALGLFLRTLYETDEGIDSLLIETDRDGYFVLRNDAVVESVIPPMEEIRGRVIEAWQREERFNRTVAEAEAVKARIENGASIEEVAGLNGYDWAEAADMTRDNPGAARLPGELLQSLFGGQQGDVFMTRTAGGYMIGALTTVNEVNELESGAADGINALGRSLAAGLGTDMLAQLRSSLEEDYSIQIDQEVVDTLYFPSARHSGM